MKKKSYWNYRIIKTPDKKLKGLPQTYSYGIYDIYYEDGVPTSWGAEPQHPIGETYMELCEDLSNMQTALSDKVLVLEKGKLVEGSRFN